jgi:multiple sugar transport system permease protein
VVADERSATDAPERTGWRERGRRVLASDHLAGWAFVAPATVIIAVFGIVPIVWSALISFQRNDLTSPPTGVGLANYRALLKDPTFGSAVGHTLVYTALFVPLSVAGGLALAVALNRKVRFMRFYRFAVFVPVVTSTVATGLVFLWLLDPTYGIVNAGLGKVGAAPQGFLLDPNQALYCVVAMTVWSWLGFNVIVYLAALQGIPGELLEAAEIDGASRWSAFRTITLPQLGPATLFLVVWSTINALQVFDEIYVTTRGGPLGSTTVVVFYLYQWAFQFFHAGYAAAIAYTLFIAILVLTLIQLWIGRRRVYYAS